MIEWTADQEDLRAGIAQWCEAFSADHVERDEEGTFSWEKWKLVRRAGILALPFGEEWGGDGLDLITTMGVLEKLGEGNRDAGLTFSITTSICSTGVPLEAFGSTALKEQYLRQITSGEAIGAHAITEPSGGSDALDMQTTAKRDGGEFVINGSKTFISNGPVADLFVVYALTRPGAGALGITAFLVPRDTPGLVVGKPMKKMGLRTSPLSELFFDDCRVPVGNVIGRVGAGFMVLDHVMKREILFSFITNVGEMRHRLDTCVAYVKERTAFGQPIGSYQAIQHKLVDMLVKLETARKWLYDVAEMLVAGKAVTTEMAIAKLLTSEANLASSLAAVQIFGGHGYMAETGLEKDVRNAVAGTIYSGSTEIQYNRVASMMGL